MPKPTREEIQEAGRQLQRGGLLGRGSTRLARKVIDKAGMDGREVGFQILGAAADHKPRWRRG
ncbi:hypothetical protein ACFVTY_02100 [Streptomyces sp. NPDC058067]|uniref:hypothetical protein n=1 Tax=Streptomyces sp. NPDC058067 TaxID=3346324 RepID=UPI0036E37223